ncbi:MAG TPA: hypothetical protein ENK57_20835, partial [Polyangiaceae bacterium]|nr:hypothetical protein [Polyangiaceae bacterium]
MSESPGSYGQILVSSGLGALVAAEDVTALPEPLRAVHHVFLCILRLVLDDVVPYRVQESGRYRYKLELEVPESARSEIDALWSHESQAGVGAHNIPKWSKALLGYAGINKVLSNPNMVRHAFSALDASRKGVLLDHSDGIFWWSVVEPALAVLYTGLLRTGPRIGQPGESDPWLQSWEEVEELYEVVGLERELIEILGNRILWVEMAVDERLGIRARFAEALRSADPARIAQAVRLTFTRKLAAQFYKKANKQGVALRRRVVSKAFQPAFNGFFAGNWGAFLGYIGESAHPDEKVFQALPEPRLMTAGKERVASVAAALGLPEEQVASMLASYWEVGATQSPPAQRHGVSIKFWRVFDQHHAALQSGDSTLWGLVQQHPAHPVDCTGAEPSYGGVYREGLFRELVPPDLQEEIEALWSCCVRSGWPDRLTTSLDPHHLFAMSQGPALALWEGVSLTCWFYCEGPSSRTDLQGMANYYRGKLLELEELRCPVDPEMFAELIAAEAGLGPAEPIRENVHEAFGITLSIGFGSTRRTGFESLRDIVTRYR